jgi:hypothetical protein
MTQDPERYIPDPVRPNPAEQKPDGSQDDVGRARPQPDGAAPGTNPAGRPRKDELAPIDPAMAAR